MSKLFLGNGAASRYVCLVATLTGTQVERITADDAAAQLAKVSATAQLPALVTGTEVSSGAIAVAQALAKPQNAALLGSGEEVTKFVEYALGDVEKAVSGEMKANLAVLHKLNKQIQAVTFVAGNTCTLADIALFSVLKGRISAWSSEERVALVSICRWYDNMQHLKAIEAHLPADYRVEFVLDIPKATPKTGGKDKKAEAEKDTKKSDDKKEAAKTEKPAGEAKKAGGDAKKSGGEAKKAGGDAKKPAGEAKKTGGEAKQAAESSAADSSAGVDADFHRVDFRVGKIVECAPHPEADSLYVEKIDLGEESGPRTIVSGLVKFVPLDQMLNRLVVVVANLKPAKLRGVMSAGMVLAASNADHTKVELVDPPVGAKPGERITFAGFPGDADAQLNPKKKLFDDVKPHLHTNADKVAQYKNVPFMTSAGPCTVVSLSDSTLG